MTSERGQCQCGCDQYGPKRETRTQKASETSKKFKRFRPYLCSEAGESYELRYDRLQVQQGNGLLQRALAVELAGLGPDSHRALKLVA